MAHVVTSEAFMDWLRKAGVIPEQTRRVVIDAEAGKIPIIYAELFVSDEMIKVEPPPELHAADIRVLSKTDTVT